VNLALLKAELLHARIRRHGLSWRERLFSSVDLLGQLGCLTPRLANALLQSGAVRRLAQNLFDIAAQRPLPPYARNDSTAGLRGVRPRSRRRARAGFCGTTRLCAITSRTSAHGGGGGAGGGRFSPCCWRNAKCCGRPPSARAAWTKRAAGPAQHAIVEQRTATTPVMFLEPSCYSMFAEDYRELKLPARNMMAARCFLFGEFFENFLANEPLALRFNDNPERLIVHLHCHAKALVSDEAMRRLLERLPERTVTLLDTGCCGMAGAFGMMESKYELSVKVAEPLIRAVRNQPFGTTVVASGASCRQQIQHLAPVRVRHMVEVVAEAMA
jgi:hypothetical protein